MTVMQNPSTLIVELELHRQAMPEQRWTDNQGHLWRWRDSGGSQPALLLLPGAAGSGDAAFRLADALIDERRVLTITYPSDAEAADLADGLAGLMARLACAQAHIWTSSYAAWWVQAFAMRHPALLTGLWLGNGLFDGRDVSDLPLFDIDWLQSQSAQKVQARWHAAAEQRPPSDLRELLLEMLGQSLSPQELHARFLRVASAHAIVVQPGALACPVVVAHCADDPIIRACAHARSHAQWPSAAQLLLPAGGHYPHVTHLDLLLPPMREWLRTSPSH